MLVLSRKVGQQISIPPFDILVTVLEVTGRRVRLGITAPKKFSVVRQELLNRMSNPSSDKGDPGNDTETS